MYQNSLYSSYNSSISLKLFQKNDLPKFKPQSMIFKDFLDLTSNCLNNLMFHSFFIIKLTLQPYWATQFSPNIQNTPSIFHLPGQPSFYSFYSFFFFTSFYSSAFWNPTQPWTSLIKINQSKEESLIYPLNP